VVLDQGLLLTTQPTNRPTIFGIWTGILAALLHSILDGNLSVVPANTPHFYTLLGLLNKPK